MIDNIVANHLLLSDYGLDRWLLSYSQKSGDGSGGDGGCENSRLLVTKVQMEKFGVCRKPLRDHIHTPIQPGAFAGQLRGSHDGLHPVSRNVRIGAVVEREPCPGYHRPGGRASAPGQPGGAGDNGLLPDNQPGGPLDAVWPPGSDDAVGEQATAVWAPAAQPSAGRPGKGDSGGANRDWVAAHKCPGLHGTD